MNAHLIFDSGCCKWFETANGEYCMEQLCPLHANALELRRELTRMVNHCRGHMPDPRYPNWHDDDCCGTARALLRAAGVEEKP